MKKRNLLILACGALLAGATLTACSSNQSKVGIGIDQVKTVGFMQLANENKERIWFDVNDSNSDGEISKDDTITDIYIIKSGKMFIYNVPNLELKDIKDKNEAEIKKLAYEEDEKYFEENLKAAIERWEYKVSSAQSGLEEWQRPESIQAMREDPSLIWHQFPDLEVSNVDELLVKLAEEVENRKNILEKYKNLNYSDYSKLNMGKDIKAIVETDSSGNNVVSEKFDVYLIDSNVYLDRLDDSTSELQTYTIVLKNQVSGEIFDKFYTGYSFSRDSFLITSSLDKNVTLGFDTLDTKNVTEE
ncbi:hypothetical protein HPB00_10540 [Streptococcus suis]|nr:hypothetical protein [Streptococcus suis]